MVFDMCIRINDDLQKTFDRYKAFKDGRKPEKFVPAETDQKNELLKPSHLYMAPSPVEESKQEESDDIIERLNNILIKNQKDTGPEELVSRQYVEKHYDHFATGGEILSAAA